MTIWRLLVQTVGFLSAIGVLRHWARWGQGHNIGYPSISAMFGERALKSPLHGIGFVPPDVMRAELAVCRLEWPDRAIIIQRYQRKRTFSHIGATWNISKWQASRRLKQAERAFHHEYNQGGFHRAPSSARFRPSCKATPVRCKPLLVGSVG